MRIDENEMNANGRTSGRTEQQSAFNVISEAANRVVILLHFISSFKSLTRARAFFVCLCSGKSCEHFKGIIGFEGSLLMLGTCLDVFCQCQYCSSCSTAIVFLIVFSLFDQISENYFENPWEW